MATDLQQVSGLDLRLLPEDLALAFGDEIAHPAGEKRFLDDVRATLADTNADGPEHLYTIYMDIHEKRHATALHEQGLLYGAVVYNHGAIGEERLRSQGHIHSRHPVSGLRHSEVYEFWTGNGFVYLQKECSDVVTRALLVPVGPGDKVIVPLGWVHLTIASPNEVLSFGAWCARDNKLEYETLRSLGGPAHFMGADGGLVKNPAYQRVADAEVIRPGELPLLGIPGDRPIYTSWMETPELFEFLPCPKVVGDAWDNV